MNRGPFSLSAVFADWVSLEWERTSHRSPRTMIKRRTRMVVLYFVAPLLGAAGVFVTSSSLQQDALLAGAIFFAGLLMNQFFQVSEWAEQVTQTALEQSVFASLADSSVREKVNDRFKVVEATYLTMAWASIVSFAVVLGMLVLSLECPAVDICESTAGVREVGTRVLNTVTAFGLLHLLTLVLVAVNRGYYYTQKTFDFNRRHINSRLSDRAREKRVEYHQQRIEEPK